MRPALHLTLHVKQIHCARVGESSAANLLSTTFGGQAPSLPWHCEEAHTFHTGTQITAVLYLIKRITAKNLF